MSIFLRSSITIMKKYDEKKDDNNDDNNDNDFN